MKTIDVSKLDADELKEYKKQQLDAIRFYHRDLIADLGISQLDFNMKMPFYNSRGDMVVGIFASEFKKEKGLFFELITRNLNPSTEERTVYRIPASSTFEDEYEMNEKGSFLVPIEELRKVNIQSVAISKSAVITSNDNFYVKPEPARVTVAPKASAPEEDVPYTEMTIRDYFAIQTGKPLSNKSWLNDLIKSNK